MILIRKGQNNTVILTLNEKKTLASPVFLFRLINDIQRSEVSFIASDISAYPDRYNKFIVTETSGTQDPTHGVVELLPAGYYHYEVYEQIQTSNLDYLLSLNPHSPLEIGKLLVVGTPTPFIRYEGQDQEYKVYTGQ